MRPRLLGLLALTTKAYSATIRLGAATDTDDAEGEVLTSADASQVTDAEIAAIVATLTGDIKQIPASVSAIKVDGQRALLWCVREKPSSCAASVTVSDFRGSGLGEMSRVASSDLDVDVSARAVRTSARLPATSVVSWASAVI